MKIRKLNLQFFADPTDPPGDPTPPNDPPVDPPKTFTQEDLDKIISKRLDRAQKEWQTQLEDEKKKAAMTEAERLKAEKDEALSKAAKTEQAANQRLISAESKIVAAELGVNPKRINHLLKLADLSAVVVDESGNIDTQAIKQSIEAVLADFPELKGNGSAVGGSGNPAGASGSNNPTDFRNASKDDFAKALSQFGLRPY